MIIKRLGHSLLTFAKLSYFNYAAAKLLIFSRIWNPQADLRPYLLALSFSNLHICTQSTFAHTSSDIAHSILF